MSTVIEVEKLCKSYGEIKAVNNVSLTVVQGEIFGMLGPNGAGKTTTMEIVEGLRPADSGSVSVLGMDIKQRSRRIKASIGVQLQTTSLYPRLKVHEVLDLFGSFFPKLFRMTNSSSWWTWRTAGTSYASISRAGSNSGCL
jgi:ABC-2 type transport system ATP-binding protein